MKKLAVKLSWIAAGQAGIHFLHQAVLWSVLWSGEYDFVTILLTAAFAVTVRLTFFLTRLPEPVLGDSGVRYSFKRMIEDEAVVAAGTLALIYATNLLISPPTAAKFCLMNLAVQAGHVYLSKRLMVSAASQTSPWRDERDQKEILIIGAGKKGMKTADLILDNPQNRTRIVGFLDYQRTGLWRYRDIPLIGHPHMTEQIIANGRLDAVMIAVEDDELPKTKSVFDTVEAMGVPVCFIPSVLEPKFARRGLCRLGDEAIIYFRAVPDNRFLNAIKAAVDRIGAAAGLILSAPIFFLVAAAIKLESKGPILFKQKRSGLNGKFFFLYKFRTMYRDAEKMKASLLDRNEMSGPVFKIKNDPRVTRVGRFLRKTSLDEVPQFLNVLKGEMSLVGPRPPLPKEVALFEPWQRRKLSVKPGVTCTWQVSGRNNIDFEDWMKLDLQYIDNWSLLEDTKLIVQTIPAVIKGSGAS